MPQVFNELIGQATLHWPAVDEEWSASGENCSISSTWCAVSGCFWNKDNKMFLEWYYESQHVFICCTLKLNETSMIRFKITSAFKQSLSIETQDKVWGGTLLSV